MLIQIILSLGLVVAHGAGELGALVHGRAVHSQQVRPRRRVFAVLARILAIHVHIPRVLQQVALQRGHIVTFVTRKMTVLSLVLVDFERGGSRKRTLVTEILSNAMLDAQVISKGRFQVSGEGTSIALITVNGRGLCRMNRLLVSEQTAPICRGIFT